MWSVSNNIFHRRQRKSGDEPWAEKCVIISFSLVIDFHFRYSSSTFFFRLKRLSWGTLFCLKNAWKKQALLWLRAYSKTFEQGNFAWFSTVWIPTSLYHTTYKGGLLFHCDTTVTVLSLTKLCDKLPQEKNGFSSFLFYFLIFKPSDLPCTRSYQLIKSDLRIVKGNVANAFLKK